MSSAALRIRPRVRVAVLRRVALAAAGVVAAALAAGALYLVTLPGVGGAHARVDSILDAHGVASDRLTVPRRVAAAAVSVEDEHFYANVAVNVASGVGRAALALLQSGQDGGGSTIDQQLAKELYGQGTGPLASLHALGLGVKLALQYSPRQIMAMYLNASYYGNGYWGIAAAARGYFGVTPSQLTWPEAAMLAGLLQAPSAYDPLHHLAAAKQRQRHVLRQLAANHYLTDAQAQAAAAAKLPLRRSR